MSKGAHRLPNDDIKVIHCCACKKWVAVPEKRRISLCRPCHNAYQKAWSLKNPEKRKAYRKRCYYKDLSKSRSYHRLYKYKTNPEEIEQRLLAQENRCAICKTNDWGKRGPQIDHCHKTKQIRGLLCLQCNVGLGSFRDSPIALIAAAKYLESI